MTYLHINRKQRKFTEHEYHKHGLRKVLLYSGFVEGKVFMNCPCPDFQGENFHESSIALSAYYIILMPANAITVFNNYIVQVGQNLSK